MISILWVVTVRGLNPIGAVISIDWVVTSRGRKDVFDPPTISKVAVVKVLGVKAGLGAARTSIAAVVTVFGRKGGIPCRGGAITGVLTPGALAGVRVVPGGICRVFVAWDPRQLLLRSGSQTVSAVRVGEMLTNRMCVVSSIMRRVRQRVSGMFESLMLSLNLSGWGSYLIATFSDADVGAGLGFESEAGVTGWQNCRC